MNVLVVNGEIKLILAQHHQVSKLNGIDAEVCGKLCLEGNGRRIDLKLVHKNLLYSLKHK